MARLPFVLFSPNTQLIAPYLCVNEGGGNRGKFLGEGSSSDGAGGLTHEVGQRRDGHGAGDAQAV